MFNVSSSLQICEHHELTGYSLYNKLLLPTAHGHSHTVWRPGMNDLLLWIQIQFKKKIIPGHVVHIWETEVGEGDGFAWVGGSAPWLSDRNLTSRLLISPTRWLKLFWRGRRASWVFLKGTLEWLKKQGSWRNKRRGPRIYQTRCYRWKSLPTASSSHRGCHLSVLISIL